jgi:hypothetical protein
MFKDPENSNQPMTIIDHLIKLYVWQCWGSSVIGQVVGLINFTLVLTIALGQKGIVISWWEYPALFLALGSVYVIWGYIFKVCDIQNRITSYSNTASNPQITQLCSDVTEIKKKLEDRK